MTLQTIPGGLWIPKPWQGANNSLVTQSSESITASTHKVVFVFRIPKTGSLTKLEFLVNSVTTPSTCNCRLETVSLTDGNPTGSLYSAGASNTFTPSAGWTSVTLTTPASVTAGDLVALVVEATTTISITIGTVQVQDAVFPYPARFAPSVWSKRTDRPQIAVFIASAYEYIADCYPVSVITNTTYNSGSTPDEYALKFQLPFPARCAGFWFAADLDGDVDVKLYDSDGTTVLATQSFDKDVRQANTVGLFTGKWATAVALTASTNYRLALTPSSATSLVINRFTYPSSGVMAAAEGGANFSESSRTDAGAWTDTALNRLVCGLLFDQFDDGGGGGLRTYANAG